MAKAETMFTPRRAYGEVCCIMNSFNTTYQYIDLYIW